MSYTKAVLQHITLMTLNADFCWFICATEELAIAFNQQLNRRLQRRSKFDIFIEHCLTKLHTRDIGELPNICA